MNSRICRCLKTCGVGVATLLLIIAIAPASAFAADEPKAPAQKPAPDKAPGDKPAVELARVDGQPIYDADVELTLIKTPAIAAGDRANPLIRAAVLNQLIQRRLVEKFLEAKKIAATPQEVDVEVGRIKAQLDRAKQTLEQMLAKTGQTETAFKAELAWELGWQRLIKQQVTDEALEAYFKAHQREFDGSELHVGHILLRPSVAADDAAAASLVKQAAEIRQQILDKKITFEDAATKYSSGPSREKGGDLGFIGRHGPMVEAFNKAAFSLGPDQVSEPVVTPFGVHLIRALSVRPGTKKWTDVRDQLRAAVTEQLFQQVAQKELATAKVEFAPGVPHFKPGTMQIE